MSIQVVWSGIAVTDPEELWDALRRVNVQRFTNYMDEIYPQGVQWRETLWDNNCPGLKNIFQDSWTVKYLVQEVIQSENK